MALTLEEAEQRFLEGISPDLTTAMRKFEECIARAAAIDGIDPGALRAMALSTQYLSDRLGVRVTDEVAYRGSMVPRVIPNAEEINRDPEAYAMNLHGTERAAFVALASFLYYNYGGGGLTDASFDAIEWVYRKSVGRALIANEKIGAPAIERIRAKLPVAMGSLNKLKISDGTLYEYLSDPTGVWWSVKLDGVTCLVVYDRGEPSKVYTGGDGVTGADVTYLAPYLHLPTPEGFSGLVRGELVVSKKSFSAYRLAYANPRSFVASRVNSGYITPGVSDLEFLAYELIDQGSRGLYDVRQEFQLLEGMGFSLPSRGFLDRTTVYVLIETYRKARTDSPYAIDGLVISTRTRPRVAFKMLLEEQVRQTYLTNIEWNVSRYGKLIPKAIYRAVYIDGTRQTKASLSNYRKVMDLGLAKNQPIEVVRSGDVIPMIRSFGEAPPGAPKFEPPTDVKWVVRGPDAVLVDIEGSIDVAIQRVVHFAEVMRVKRFGEESIRKIIGVAANSPSFRPAEVFRVLYGMSVKAFMTILPGRQGLEARTNLHASLETARLDRLVAATSIMEGIGRATIKAVIPYVPMIFGLTTTQITNALNTIKVPGIGPSKTAALATGIPKLRAFLEELDVEAAAKAIAYNQALGTAIAANAKDPKAKFAKVEVVFTKFLGTPDLDLEDEITDEGGSIGSKVGPSTTVVITNNPAASSSKTIAAAEMGKPVMTVREFRAAYGIFRG